MENYSQNEPLVSVIIPVYNVTDYLRRCLDSVCIQRYTNLEIILVDDGSTDGSGAICDDYAQQDRRIHVIHQENRGAATARNQGLSVATGAYIAFVDSDDFVHREYIACLLELCITQHCEVAQCAFERGVQSYFSQPTKRDTLEIRNRDNLFDDRCLKITVWGKLFHRPLMEGHRFLDGATYEDEGFTYAVLYQANQIVLTHQRLYYYYQRDGSCMRNNGEVSLGFMKFLPARLHFFRQYQDEKQVNITHKEYAIKLMLAYIRASASQRQQIIEPFRNQYENIVLAPYLSSKELWILKILSFMPRQVAFGANLLSRLGL